MTATVTVISLIVLVQSLPMVLFEISEPSDRHFMSSDFGEVARLGILFQITVAVESKYFVSKQKSTRCRGGKRTAEPFSETSETPQKEGEKQMCVRLPHMT